MPSLFDPITFGSISAQNRIIMAPLTRSRAGPSRIPNDLMVEYYRQRATAGLIISEATAISKMGFGWFGAPALYNDDHAAGWKKVTEAVHQAGGKMVLQMWHMGRVSHPDNLDGETPVSSSAIQAEGTSSTPHGRQAYVTPRALTIEEINATIKDYVAGAQRAIEAGFDGVEIHGAHGYLIDQFIRDSANHRTDQYGGALDNRLRFAIEVVEAVTRAIGADKTGIRLSPNTHTNSMDDSNPIQTFTRLAEKLNDFNLAYVHIREEVPEDKTTFTTPHFRKAYTGNLIVNGGYTQATGTELLQNKGADAIAYGKLFIANPDLVKRFQMDLPLNDITTETMYAGGPAGYIDYKAA